MTHRDWFCLSLASRAYTPLCHLLAFHVASSLLLIRLACSHRLSAFCRLTSAPTISYFDESYRSYSIYFRKNVVGGRDEITFRQNREV